jgi:A/G-specific adenine glycosylase
MQVTELTPLNADQIGVKQIGAHQIGVDQMGEFRRALLAWYRAHRRDLPWRETRDAYRIWISEIMLQQTRVAAVLEHYRRFVERFPTVNALAAATEAEVLALWSGLGYYRRARMMHRAAGVIAGEHGGRMPGSADALLKLPGIGSYTSAAIASIAFGEAVAVVDGNVERVLARMTGWPAAERRFQARVLQLAQVLVDPGAPGDFNQAMMELGATVCLPKTPLCLHCPAQPLCSTRGEHAAVPRKKMQAREMACVFRTRGRADGVEVLLEQRSLSASLMAGMWQLPQVDRHPETKTDAAPILTVRHAITTTNYTVRVYAGGSGDASSDAAGDETSCRWFAREELAGVALTGLARKILMRLMPLQA